MSRLSVIKRKFSDLFYRAQDKTKKTLSTSTEHTFNWVYFIGSLVISAFAFYFGLAYLQILSMSLLKVAIYFLSLSGFIKFLYSVDFNILEQVFKEKNPAAGTFLAGLAIGLGIVISAII